MSRITVEDCHKLVEAEYPLAVYFGFRTEELGEGRARVRMAYSPKLLRYGGTVSGPALMAIADFAMYLVVLTLYDYDAAVRAVTTNLNVNFLRPPGRHDIVAEARVQKGGRRLCFIEVTVFSDGDDRPVAHCTGAYALPAEGG